MCDEPCHSCDGLCHQYDAPLVWRHVDNVSLMSALVAAMAGAIYCTFVHPHNLLACWAGMASPLQRVSFGTSSPQTGARGPALRITVIY